MDKTVDVNIAYIRKGDTVLCPDGKTRTVCDKDIRRGFTGITLFGDCYRLGTIPVKKVLI